MDGFQMELREFIERLKLMDYDIMSNGRRLIALRQNMRDAWATAGGRNPCFTTISGKVCSTVGIPIPGSTLSVVGHASGTNYGTFTLAAGTYSLNLRLDTSDTSLDLTANGPGSRFGSAISFTRTVSQCSPSNAIPDITPTAASGYSYHNWFAFPIANSLSLLDSLFGAYVAAGPNPWVTPNPGAVVATPGGGPCPAGTRNLLWIFRSLGLIGSGTSQIRYRYQSNSSGCPAAFGEVDLPDAYLSIVTVPSDTQKLDLLWSIPAGSVEANDLYGGLAATTRVYEP